MKQIIRKKWYEVLERVCCGTCTHSDSYGKEIPPSDMTLCNLHGTVERVRRENNCPDYSGGN